VVGLARMGQVGLLALTLWGALFRGPLFGGIALTCLGLAFGPELVSRSRSLPSGVAPGWVALLLAHVALGMGLELYQTSALYDKVVHFLAFAWVGWLLSSEVERWSRANRVRLPARSWLIGLAALGLGACWELLEFGVDQLGVVVCQPSLEDTMLDFICDGAGALAAIGGRALVAIGGRVILS